MILRRVIAHVRKQEWTAIALDFVIVVFGVFFGIQVSNWNGSRLDAQRAHGYLARIHGARNRQQLQQIIRLRIGILFVAGASAGV